jgi:hypothetical protein
VTVLDDGEPREQIPAHVIGLGGRELPVEEGGVPLVAVVLVPRGFGRRPLLLRGRHPWIVAPVRRRL